MPILNDSMTVEVGISLAKIIGVVCTQKPFLNRSGTLKTIIINVHFLLKVRFK